MSDGTTGPDDRGDDVAEGGEEPSGDRLPEDLDVSTYVGTYTFPDLRRRGRIAFVYVAAMVAVVAGWALTENTGVLAALGVLGVIALIHLFTSWPLRIDQTDALVVATREVGFPVGHASAQLAFRGLRSRPTWRILLYSADEPPSKRGLVELDGVEGTVLGQYTEDNPEDWSAYE